MLSIKKCREILGKKYSKLTDEEVVKIRDEMHTLAEICIDSYIEKNKKTVNKMNKKEIIYWRDKYNEEEDLYTTGIEEDLRKKFQKNKYITKSDLIEIVKWKFQINQLLGRRKRILNLLNQVDDSYIQKATKSAFESKNDEVRLKLITSIKGVANALSSVILTFYDSKNYGILDIHAWRALFGKEPQDLFINKKRALEYFNILRKISLKTNLPCRDIEKALFKKDFDKSKEK